ncbi:MAG: D-alanyl-D-alanine carboxypeptidase, partial [Lachnospiraceae bacterium]|nr:D-alanyl-D-alanine carboxypeptidase [Lachnospiraceae bacterium]
MIIKKPFFFRALSCFLMTALLLCGSLSLAWADEGDEEEEYIPEEYYEPVQSNSVAGWPEGQAIQAAAGVVLDMDTGAFLYSKNCDRKLYPASITKIMTCLLTLENADLDAVMTCSPIVYELDENASNTGLSEGEQMSIRDALYTLMLESANDTANALAEYVGGSMEGFAQMMNAKAESLGCTGTHFSNPSGLHADDHYTTAHDMALIAQAAYANETFRTICGTVEYEVPPTNMYEETRYLSNHHQMLKGDTDYYTSWCTGGKTGFTQMAWNTLVTYGERDGKRLVCVLLHGNGADQNYLETIDLLNYGFNNFQHVFMGSGPDDRTLASLMKVQYLGKAASLEAPELSQVASHVGGVRTVSIPADASAADVVVSSGNVQPVPGEPGRVPYMFHDWPVGSMTLSVNPVSLGVSYPWQVMVRVRAEGETGDKEVSIKDTSDIVWQDVGSFANNMAGKVTVFVEKNRKT